MSPVKLLQITLLLRLLVDDRKLWFATYTLLVAAVASEAVYQ